MGELDLDLSPAAISSRTAGSGGPAPDLLFEEQQLHRLHDIRHLLETPELLTAGDPLHRITCFLTYRCNLNCSFCRTVSSEILQRTRDFTVESFARMLDTHAGTPIAHIHLTGGEAALVARAADILRLARQRAAAVSLTSNGTLPPVIYVRLIDSGLDEIRVSLSASDAGTGLAISGEDGAWARTMRTVRALAALRARRRDFHLVLNTLVSRQNRELLPRIVRDMVNFLPDDIKLIAAVQELRTLGSFDNVRAVIRKIEAQLCSLPPASIPLLRRKVRTVFDPDAVGLRSLSDEEPAEWRCYVPLTERTVDSESYYPCSVYVREGGAPLGRISDSPDTQRRKTVVFVRNAKCLEDPICREFCLHCTRRFNELANRTRKGQLEWKPALSA